MSGDAMPLSRTHMRRLRQMYRSAGWPCLDAIEIDLLHAGLLERIRVEAGQSEFLRVTDAGISAIAGAIQGNRAAFNAHESLVQKVADLQLAQGRIAYLDLTLLSKPEEAWQHSRPDVFSIRKTSSERYLEPAIHEIKVRRADLLGDLKKPAKREGYLAAAGQCYYVLAEGIGSADDIPPNCGVIIEAGGRLVTVRAAPRSQIFTPSFSTWMSLARATPYRPPLPPSPML